MSTTLLHQHATSQRRDTRPVPPPIVSPILTLSGPPGGGKTTLINCCGNCEPRIQLIPSYASDNRGIRPSDLPGEYRFVDKTMLQHMNLAWYEQPHGAEGVHYGTRQVDIDEAVQSEMMRIMHLTPTRAKTLYEYVGKDGMVPFFIFTRSEEILEQRLRQRDRGKPESYYAERLQTSRHWYEEAKNSGVPFTFIDNSGGQAPMQILLQIITTLRDKRIPEERVGRLYSYLADANDD